MRLSGFDTSVSRDSGSQSQVNHLVKHQHGLEASERTAQKLRAQGLSYRRIAELLSVRYDMVAQWLAGLPGTYERSMEPSPAVHTAIAPQAESQPAAFTSAATRISALEHRLSEAFTLLQRLSDAGRRREERLLTTLTEERQSARLQIERLDAEVAALRATLEALSSTDNGAPLNAESAASPPSRGFWRWGAKK
jgi:predicted transcriptional regulator